MEDTSRSIAMTATLYERDNVTLVLDRSFQEFGQAVTASVTQSVEQFFQDYEDLFYEIPVTGATGSHQYLVEKSSELYHVDESLEDIQPLLDEINLLRSQSVADQETILQLRTELGQTNSVTAE